MKGASGDRNTIKTIMKGASGDRNTIKTITTELIEYNNDQVKVVERKKAENRRSDTFRTTKLLNKVQEKVDNDPTKLFKEMGAR